jgi:two-component system OmpR family response regulator
MSKVRILVVDDEPGVREMLTDALNLQGYAVTPAKDGFEALKQLREGEFELVVSDINMPKVDGYELLERMRNVGDSTPVILLTARGEKADLARGFRVGADDYVTKPFGLEELSLRISAVLRRTFSAESSSSQLECGPLVLDQEAHTVTVEGKVVELSQTEFRLLVELLERKEKVATKSALLDSVWGINWDTNVSVLDTYISYLRKKLHTDTWQGIKTVRGVGFQITSKP